MTITDTQRAAVLDAVKNLGDGFSETGHKLTWKNVPVFDEFDSPRQEVCTCGGYVGYSDKKCVRETAANALLEAFGLERQTA